MKTQTIERTILSTCSNCPYFQDFAEQNGRGWCQIFDQMARQHHERTGTCDQEMETLNKEAQQKAGDEPVSFGEDSVVGLQPTQAATEFEQGCQHGRNDALEGWHPIYKEPSTEYARGYLRGYNDVLNSRTQPQQVLAPAEAWSVSYDPKWDWYQAWVGDRCIGHGSTHHAAECIAQRYITTNEMIRRQNAAVLKAYAA